MSVAKFRKEVSQLPATLEPDTIYAIRTGAGFDLYISDSTGAIAYKTNEKQEVFIDNLPAITYPAIGYEEVAGYPGLYMEYINT